jgi:hypothetical protein
MLCPTLSFMNYVPNECHWFSHLVFLWLMVGCWTHWPHPVVFNRPVHRAGTGSASANVALGGVSFTMGCHIEYTTLGKTMQLAPTMAGNGNRTTYKNGEVGEWFIIFLSCFIHIICIYIVLLPLTWYASRGLWLAIDLILLRKFY